MNLKLNKCKIIKICNALLMAVLSELIKNIKFRKGDDSKTEMTEDHILRITPISAGPARSEGNGCASPNLECKVIAMKSITKNDLTFLERTKRVSSKHPDILEYMLKSSDLLDRVIAKRILQNAIGGI